MKISSISKAAIALGINALVLGGLVAGPASADPAAGVFGDLVGTGSDTIQDVDNGLSAALGTNPDTGNLYIASYDAAPSSGAGSAAGDCASGDTITTQDGAAAFTRPNGSGNGRDTLRAAIGQASSASVKSYACGLSGGSSVTLNATAVRGLVQYGRSSGGPASADTTAAGVLTYIPFAKDAVSVAVSPDSKIPALTFGTSAVNTAVGGVTGKVESTLYAIYTCKATKVIVPDSGAPFLANDSYSGAGTAHDLHVYIPQAGSGTRSFWIGKFNVTEANITAAAANASCLKATIQGGAHDGEDVQEHSGLAVGSDDYGITPFSIPQFVAQNNGVVTSRINGAVIRGIGGVAATTGTGSAIALNPTFTTAAATSMLGRLVYHIVPSREADDPNSLTHEVFVGRDSKVCQATSTITHYGFAALTATSGSSSCGNTTVRAYAPSTATFTMDVVNGGSGTSPSTVTSASEGDTVYFRVKALTSNGDGGGTVQLSDGAGNVFDEFEIAPGTPPGNASFTAGADDYQYEAVTLDTDLPAGGYDVVATFIPNLPGVETKIAANLISFALDQRSIDSLDSVADLTTFKVKKAGIVDVTVNATGITPTGSVTIFSGATALGSADLDESGVAHVVFSKKFKKAASLTLTISYSGDNTYLSDSDTVPVTVTKK
ncbi:MAG: hypothetical protein RLZZ319_742 [Actinomycetota bacterium]|jgi:hypothetical protein